MFSLKQQQDASFLKASKLALGFNQPPIQCVQVVKRSDLKLGLKMNVSVPTALVSFQDIDENIFNFTS